MSPSNEQKLVEALAHLKAAERLLNQVTASFCNDTHMNRAHDSTTEAVCSLEASLDSHGVKLTK